MSNFFPQGDPQQPSLKAMFDDLRRQIRLMSLKGENEDVAGQVRTEVVFSYHGPVTANDPSGDYLIKDFAATINNLLVTAKVGGTGSSTLDLKINDVTQFSTTIPSGQTLYAVEDLAIDVEEWDRVSVDFSTVGTGLSTVVVHLQVVAPEDSSYT